MRSRLHPWAMVAALAATLPGAMQAHAEMSAEDLAKLAQNPVGNLISLPWQIRAQVQLMFPR